GGNHKSCVHTVTCGISDCNRELTVVSEIEVVIVPTDLCRGTHLKSHIKIRKFRWSIWQH
ncbi:hypothetical protein F4001_06925, partial [Candidatus Poribacteria bacterium]|nr:hypothetical protein [Candidatus Poribacteria bacterium]